MFNIIVELPQTVLLVLVLFVGFLFCLCFFCVESGVRWC